MMSQLWQHGRETDREIVLCVGILFVADGQLATDQVPATLV